MSNRWNIQGQTVYDVMQMRDGRVGRMPDIVVWPRSATEVDRIVHAAHEYGVVIIPFGGMRTLSLRI